MRPMVMFRWGVYASLGVLAVVAAAAAVYTTRAVLVRVLIALFVAISLEPAVRLSLVASLPSRLGGGLFGITRRLFGALFSTLTVVVLTIYFMADLPRLRNGLLLLFPRAHRAQSGRIAEVMVDKVGAYMIGKRPPCCWPP